MRRLSPAEARRLDKIRKLYREAQEVGLEEEILRVMGPSAELPREREEPEVTVTFEEYRAACRRAAGLDRTAPNCEPPDYWRVKKPSVPLDRQNGKTIPEGG